MAAPSLEVQRPRMSVIFEAIFMPALGCRFFAPSRADGTFPSINGSRPASDSRTGAGTEARTDRVPILASARPR